jgi:small subunit ribosomal protein S16
VADRRSPRDGKFIEIIGAYDPKKPGDNSTLNIDRVEYWISKGAQPSDTVRSLIKKNKKATTTAEPAAKADQKEETSVQDELPPSAPSAEVST